MKPHITIVDVKKRPCGELRVEYSLGGVLYRAFRKEKEVPLMGTTMISKHVIWRFVQLEPGVKVIGTTEKYNKFLYDTASRLSRALELPQFP